jgi:predicted nuclease with RNAse H fold
MTNLVVGIDVGGSKKGFHLVNMIPGSVGIRGIKHSQSVDDVLSLLGKLGREVLVAVDCPPKCQLSGDRTRFAERQLHQRGFRVQWTRRQSHDPAEWMQNGTALWTALAGLDGVSVIETFPRVATASLHGSGVVLPLTVFSPYTGRRDWKDFVDVAICAEVGDRYLRANAASVGFDPATGETDELGLIWF